MRLKVLAPFQGRLSKEVYWPAGTEVEVEGPDGLVLLNTWPAWFERIDVAVEWKTRKK